MHSNRGASGWRVQFSRRRIDLLPRCCRKCGYTSSLRSRNVTRGTCGVHRPPFTTPSDMWHIGHCVRRALRSSSHQREPTEDHLLFWTGVWAQLLSCFFVFFYLHVRASRKRLTVFKWRILNVLYLHLHESFAPASCFACVSHANMQISNLLLHLHLGHIYFTLYFYSACLFFCPKVRRQLKSVIWFFYWDSKKQISVPFFKCCIKSRTSFSLKITQS